MRKRWTVTIVSILLFTVIAGCATTKPYQPSQTQAKMQEILGALMGMQPALEGGDFAAVEENFEVIISAFNKLSKMEPPTGDEEDWLRIQEGIIELSEEGIEAAQAEDGQEVGRILGEIQKLQGEGHDKFQNY